MKNKRLTQIPHKSKLRFGNWIKKYIFFTLTVILWLSGRGYPSLGLTTLYFPTVIALILISSEMHLVLPIWRSNLIELTKLVNARVRIARRRIEFDIAAILIFLNLGSEREIRVWIESEKRNQNDIGKELKTKKRKILVLLVCYGGNRWRDFEKLV